MQISKHHAVFLKMIFQISNSCLNNLFRCTNSLWNGCERQGTRKNIINPIMSARLRTVNSFAFKYGKIEIRAKIPTGDFIWPGILFY